MPTIYLLFTDPDFPFNTNLNGSLYEQLILKTECSLNTNFLFSLTFFQFLLMFLVWIHLAYSLSFSIVYHGKLWIVKRVYKGELQSQCIVSNGVM